MTREETSKVLYFGTRLKRKHRKVWNKVERDAFEDSPNHVMEHVPRGENVEFLVLYSEGDPVGRASTSLGEGWLSEGRKKENIGFIDGFIIHPDYRHLAGDLIDRCLSTLRERGAAGVIVRSQGFPALAAQEFDDLAPCHLPANPPWYIDLFEVKGFVKHSEWANFRLTLPREISQADLAAWETLRASQGITVRKLKGGSRKELKQYSDITYDLLSDHYGYTPSRLMDSYSFIRFLSFGLLTRIARVRIYVLRNQSGEIVGFSSYHPDYNILRHSLANRSKVRWYSILAPVKQIVGFVRDMRGAKRATIGSIGLRRGSRGTGLVLGIMDFGLKLIIEEGYEQLDTGPVLIDNAVVVKMVERIGRRHAASVKRMTYYTLQYEF
jgi:hypothetical protein